MARILIIDNEKKAIEEIKKSLSSVYSQVEIKSYPSFSEFDKWLEELNPEEFKTQKIKPEEFRFDLMLLEYSLLKHDEWEAKLNNLRTKCILRNAAFLFISFEHASLNHRTTKKLNILNTIYKPFDPLILKETLNITLNRGENLNPIEIKPQSCSALVAILKEKEIISLSEVGFALKTDTLFAVNSFSKYFSPLFVNDKKQSFWAQCVSSQPLQNEPYNYLHHFHFVGLDPKVIMNLRRHIDKNKLIKDKKFDWKITAGNPDKEIKIAVLDIHENQNTQLKEDIENQFKNVCVDILVFNPIHKNKKFETKYDLVINTCPFLKQEIYKSCFHETQHVLLADRSIADHEFEEWLLVYRDIFKQPLDRRVFYKKLKMLLSDLEFKEAPEHLTVVTQDKFKVASLIKVNEICELFLKFSYHRELALGEFREFAFITEDENQIVHMPAFCNSIKKVILSPGQEPTYTYQFVFWGTTDFYLKKIRVWLRQYYVSQFEKK